MALAETNLYERHYEYHTTWRAKREALTLSTTHTHHLCRRASDIDCDIYFVIRCRGGIIGY